MRHYPTRIPVWYVVPLIAVALVFFWVGHQRADQPAPAVTSVVTSVMTSTVVSTAQVALAATPATSLEATPPVPTSAPTVTAVPPLPTAAPPTPTAAPPTAVPPTPTTAPPTATPNLNTPPGTLLKVGDAWLNGAISLTVKDVQFQTSVLRFTTSNYQGSENYGPSTEVTWTLANNGHGPSLFDTRPGSDIGLVDNTGRQYVVTSNGCQGNSAGVNGDTDIRAGGPGWKQTMSVGAGGSLQCFSFTDGLPSSGALTDLKITFHNIGRIAQAQWQVPLNQ